MLNSPQQTIDMSTLSSNSRTGAVYGGSTNVSSANNSPLTRSATQQGNLLHSSSASPSSTLNPDGSSQGFNRNNPTQQSLIGRISTTFKRRLVAGRRRFSEFTAVKPHSHYDLASVISIAIQVCFMNYCPCKIESLKFGMCV